MAASWTIVESGDFNGDGKADILWRDTSGNIVMWLSDGAGGFNGLRLGIVATSWVIQ